jgi:hypothetical protein
MHKINFVVAMGRHVLFGGPLIVAMAVGAENSTVPPNKQLRLLHPGATNG